MHILRRRLGMVAAGIDIDVATLSINYTGAHQDYGVVQMNDGDYRLLAFTSSGTLSIEQPVNCEVCVVGGGANGTNGRGGAGDGGAGAYMKHLSVSAYNGGNVIVGAGQGVSSIAADMSVSPVSGRHGGTGGGGEGTGDGLSKYPFEDTGYSLWAGKPHCAGGGEGVYEWYYDSHTDQGYRGGNGGTNGGNGYQSGSSYVSNPSGGVGGSYGGGAGGSHTTNNGENATYYGSGGGGGKYYRNPYSGAETFYNGGSGYQGIVYIRIPVNQ